MNKKGFTLIEFIVSITIFAVVMTVAIGSIVSLSRMKSVIINMKNTQQKSRSVVEYISRFAKEANGISVLDKKEVVLRYKEAGATDKKIVIADNQDLYICDINKVSTTCLSNTSRYLLSRSSSTKLDGSDGNNFFELRQNITPDLRIKLNIIGNMGTNNDALEVDTLVLLENLNQK